MVWAWKLLEYLFRLWSIDWAQFQNRPKAISWSKSWSEVKKPEVKSQFWDSSSNANHSLDLFIHQTYDQWFSRLNFLVPSGIQSFRENLNLSFSWENPLVVFHLFSVFFRLNLHAEWYIKLFKKASSNEFIVVSRELFSRGYSIDYTVPSLTSILEHVIRQFRISIILYNWNSKWPNHVF